MAKMLLAALAAAMVAVGGAPLDRAAAMTTASPSDAAHSSLMREAAVVCGGNGCNAVQTKGRAKRKFKPLGNG